MSQKIYIVGVDDSGGAGLTAETRKLIETAGVLVGAERMLALFAESRGRKVVTTGSLPELLKQLGEIDPWSMAVLLTEGDPFFYGVARYLCDRLGKDRFEIVPHVSTMQLAFARIKESWEDAYLASVSARPIEALVDRIRVAEKVGLFTDETHKPARVARELLDRGIDYFRGWVCENIGSPDERVTQGALAELADMDFSPLNVMILVREAGRPDQPREGARFRLFGNPDDAFIQSRPKSGLLTRAPVRALALSQLDVRPTSVVWDIGAGSGSLSIEAAQLAHEGAVYAIERDVSDYQLISANAEKFGVHNVRPTHGQAPEVLGDLPRPDAVFIEGVTQQLGRLLEHVHQRLLPGGRLVINVGTLENLHAAHSALRALEPDTELMVVNIARGRPQLDQVAFEPMGPGFLISATKSGQDA